MVVKVYNVGNIFFRRLILVFFYIFVNILKIKYILLRKKVNDSVNFVYFDWCIVCVMVFFMGCIVVKLNKIFF